MGPGAVKGRLRGAWLGALMLASLLAAAVTYRAMPVVAAADRDLAITKTDSADPVDTGAPLTYELIVVNHGAGPATDVQVTDSLPADTSFVSATGGCSNSAGTVTCTTASLAAGAQTVWRINVTAPTAAGTIANTASVDGAQGDSVSQNNSDSEITLVNAPSQAEARPDKGSCLARPATIVGTAGDDSLVGTAAGDVIVAGAGNDRVGGVGANDLICGEAGNDVLAGGPGADVLIGGPGRDRLRGGKSDDICTGSGGRDKGGGCERTRSVP